MRTLHADLAAAQKAPSREPVITATFRNQVEGVRRHDFEILQSIGTTDGKHDVCVASDGSVIRVRMEGGTVKFQRVTSPGSGSAWGAWTDWVTGMGTNVACAAMGANVIVVYTASGEGSIRYRESTDNGATFSADALLVAAPFSVSDLAVAYKSASSDAAVAFTTTGTPRIYLNVRTAGVWGGNVFSHAPHSVAGVALAHVLDWSLVVTGEETTTQKPTVWTTTYDGSAWGALRRQAQAETGAGVFFGSPFVTFSDAFRMTFVELQTFTGGVTRTHRSYIHKLVSFNAAEYNWRTPMPVFYANVQGIAIATGPDYVYESTPGLVRRAPRALVELVADTVVALDIAEEQGRMDGWIELQNTGGAYAGPPAPIALGNLCLVSLGYVTASGLRQSTLADMWVSGWEHRRTGGVSTLRVFLSSGWDLLRRNFQRTNIVHAAGVDSYQGIMARIAQRAGLQLVVNGMSTRGQLVTPAFTIDPSTSGYAAYLGALDFLADRSYVAENATIRCTEPLSGQAVTFDFGADHPVRRIELRAAAPRVAEAQALGAGAFGDDLDFATIEHGLGRIERIRDVTSTTAATTDATAAALRRQRRLADDHGAILCAPHVGLELLDVVSFSDAMISASAIERRIRGIRWRYDRHRELFEQELHLGPR